jgi:hypothetical protein
MSDLSPSQDPNARTRAETDRPSITGIPRWVKVFVITVIVLVGLFVVLHLTGRSLVSHLPPSLPAAP